MKSSEEKVIFSAFSHCNAFLACFTSKKIENTTDSLENNDDFNMFPRKKKADICVIFFQFYWFSTGKTLKIVRKLCIVMRVTSIV